MYMLLQRLVRTNRPDDLVNYDYMGSAEFEFGATTIPRLELAILECTEVRIRMLVKQYRNSRKEDCIPVNVVVKFPTKYGEDFTDEVDSIIQHLRDGTYSLKERLVPNDPSKLVAWMMIQPMPMLITGDAPKDKEDSEWFLEDVRRQVRESEETGVEILFRMHKEAGNGHNRLWLRNPQISEKNYA